MPQGHAWQGLREMATGADSYRRRGWSSYGMRRVMGNFGVFLIFQKLQFFGFSYAYFLRPFHVGVRTAANHVMSPDVLGTRGDHQPFVTR